MKEISKKNDSTKNNLLHTKNIREQWNLLSFSIESNGFIDLGIYRDNITEIDVVNNLNKLIEDDSFRKMLFSNMQKISFRENKKKVIRTIINLISD